jgi:glucan 1,3-beta-glucosidase
MLSFSAIALFVALRLFFSSVLLAPLSEALPTPQAAGAPSSSTYWVANIQRQGTVAFGNSSTYPIFRNVMTYGAKGDGSTDDTAAINQAISDGNRCGNGCDSSTVTPAIVYFPPGTYKVSSPIIQYYYTQFIGDAVTTPTIQAAPEFSGIAVIDSDPYIPNGWGAQWYTNQNNFFRQIRNFVIDISGMPETSGWGIHWQVAQATSLQNIEFKMAPASPTNQQRGIYMDNGSGGFMTDLTFTGGDVGAFFGNQQFTTRNLTFNGCNTAVYMNWDWVWNLKSLSINNCGVGVNMSTVEGGSSPNGNVNQTVGSVLIQDSKFTATPIGVITTFSTTNNVPATGGTLIIDNVDFTGSTQAVVDVSGATVLAGGSVIASWGQGNAYTTGAASSLTNTKRSTGSASQVPIHGSLAAPSKPTVLLNAQGAIFERSKPQYETYPASAFLSVKSNGAKGDGVTDDTAAIQATLNKATTGQIVYFDHGAYLISSTVQVPKNIMITGEIWPLIMASGAAFSDPSNPQPVFQVGQPGDTGAVEMSDLIFETKGPQPGAILVEWNVAESSQGASGMWDVHMRIGGSDGTELQSDICAKNPNVTAPANPQCIGAFLLLHVTEKATIYLENNWFWVADHELDLGDHDQIDIYNGRGVLVESAQGPVWFYGTSAEHSQLYNYQINNAQNIYMGVIQTETPYMQGNPNALTPFTPNATWTDPTFAECTTPSCIKSWGLRVVDSSNVLIYGAGLYSFFDNYSEDCLATESCQENIVSIENCSGEIYLWGLSTKGSTNMVTIDGTGAVLQSDNTDTFCQTIALFENA